MSLDIYALYAEIIRRTCFVIKIIRLHLRKKEMDFFVSCTNFTSLRAVKVGCTQEKSN